jgi:acyl-coenzyme A thioesterase PaaI-like protein
MRLVPDGPDRFHAELGATWTVGGGRAHGGLMLALLTNAGLTVLRERLGTDVPAPDPVAVSAEYLRAPVVGPAEIGAHVVKTGRTVSVVRVELHQGGTLMLSATVTAGRLPAGGGEPAWADLPALAAEPPPGARSTVEHANAVPLSGACEVVLDPETDGYLRGERGEPVVRGWARPFGEDPDVLFAVLAGDILPPTVFHLGRPGWAPTVQLTVLLRGRPAPGWLRLEAVSRVVADGWFDEDYTVVDTEGRLVCQARQIALLPRRG